VVLTGSNPQFLVLLEHAQQFEDWGVMTKLNCFRTYDQEITPTNTKIHQLQQDVATTEHDCTLCEQWLEASQCAEGLTNLEGLGPKSTHAKWGTHFTDKENNNEYCMQQARWGCRF
jgi:predicted amino acid racemase